MSHSNELTSGDQVGGDKVGGHKVVGDLVGGHKVGGDLIININRPPAQDRPKAPPLMAPPPKPVAFVERPAEYEQLVALLTNTAQAGHVAITAASTDRTLKLWDAHAGRCLATFHDEGSLLWCAFAPDGRTVATGGDDRQVYVLRVEV